MLTFACPSCHMRLHVGEDRVRHRVKCPFCDKTTTVPDRILSLGLAPPSWRRWPLLVSAALAAVLLVWLVRMWL